MVGGLFQPCVSTWLQRNAGLAFEALEQSISNLPGLWEEMQIEFLENSP